MYDFCHATGGNFGAGNKEINVFTGNIWNYKILAYCEIFAIYIVILDLKYQQIYLSNYVLNNDICYEKKMFRVENFTDDKISQFNVFEDTI